MHLITITITTAISLALATTIFATDMFNSKCVSCKGLDRNALACGQNSVVYCSTKTGEPCLITMDTCDKGRTYKSSV